MFSKTLAFAALWTVLLPTIAAEYNPNENVVLADCGIGTIPSHPDWSSSNHILYYKGAVWIDSGLSATNQPDMTVQVTGFSEYPWPAGVWIEMPNKDVFMIVIDKPDLPDGAGVAGTALHSYDINDFKCYPFHQQAVYKLPDGNWCRSAYVCNHQGGPLSQEKIQLNIATNNDAVKIDGHIPFADIFDKIKLLDNGKTCDETPTKIPGTDCRIRSKCNAFVPGLSKDMVTILKTVAGTTTEGGSIFKQETVVDTVWDPCKSGRDTCVGGYVERVTKTTTVQRSLEILAGDQNNRPLGSVRYDLSCGSPPSPGACNALWLKAAVLGALSGGAGVVASVTAAGVCALESYGDF